jgi:hypothetical protein
MQGASQGETYILHRNGGLADRSLALARRDDKDLDNEDAGFVGGKDDLETFELGGRVLLDGEEEASRVLRPIETNGESACLNMTARM